MGEKGAKICLLTINFIVMMGGVAMFIGGLLIEYTDLARSILSTVDHTLTMTELNVIGVVMVAVGAFVILVSFIGCCGAVSESRCMLGLYFICIAVLFLCQLGLVIASFVYGSLTIYAKVENQLQSLVNGYQDGTTDATAVDFMQKFFQCCGYNGTNDYRNYNKINEVATPVNATTTTTTTTATTAAMNVSTPTMMYGGKWPLSCCKTINNVYVNQTKCLDTSLPLSVRYEAANNVGCTMKIQTWVQHNLLYIGIAGAIIAAIELATMITACMLRSNLD